MIFKVHVKGYVKLYTIFVDVQSLTIPVVLLEMLMTLIMI